jgi:thioesterase domain-containing protein
VNQLAAAYIDELRKIGESQPFCLLGYSFGGLVAVEMARQLQCDGIDPPIVALIDTAPTRWAAWQTNPGNIESAAIAITGIKLHTAKVCLTSFNA